MVENHLLEERMVRVETKLDDLKEDNTEIKQTLKEINAKFEKLDSRYANKWVENAFYGFCAILLTYVIYLLLNLI